MVTSSDDVAGHRRSNRVIGRCGVGCCHDSHDPLRCAEGVASEQGQGGQDCPSFVNCFFDSP